MEDFKALGAIIAIACPIALFMYGEFRPTPRQQVKPARKPAEKPAKPPNPGPSADTIKAMHIQADAERVIADTLTRKAQREPDPIKRARLEKQVANSNLRFNKILDQIDKLTSQL